MKEVAYPLLHAGVSHRRWKPEVRRTWILKTWWPNTDDGEGRTVDARLFSEDRRIAAVGLLPETVAQNGGIRLLELFVGQREDPTSQRRNAKRLKEARIDHRALHLLSPIFEPPVLSRREIGEGAQVFEGLVLCAEVYEVLG